jgi:hypothetical protein
MVSKPVHTRHEDVDDQEVELGSLERRNPLSPSLATITPYPARLSSSLMVILHG